MVKACRSVLAGAGTAVCLFGAAQAAGSQDAPIEEVVITGSRVRGAEPVGSAVTSLGREDIQDSGQVTIDRAIKELPQNFDLGVSENSRAQSGGSGNIVYGNTINLRGIGPYATLVLVDGHRVINNSRSFDPSVLPTLGVERVEVVADGASAIYGSDAIAGVVNIIPRRSLDGVEVFGRYGLAERGDFSEGVIGTALGGMWSRGQVLFAYEHAQRDHLAGDDRDFFRSDQRPLGGGDYRVTRCNPGTVRIGPTSYAIPAGGLTAASASQLVAGTTNRCNELTGQDLFPRQEYNSASATASFDINDRFALFADGFYSQRDFVRQPGYAAATLTVPQTNAWFVRPAGFTGTSYQIDYSFSKDLSRDTATGSARSWEVTPGLRVKLPHSWQFEAVYTYGRNRDNSSSVRGVNNPALNAALASSNPATAFDPYGLGRTAPAVLALIGNQISLAPTLNKFIGYEARLNGTLYALPGGDLALAAGYEGQQQDVDLGTARGNPGTAIAFRSFARRVDSGYAELLLPVFGAGNARPGLQRLAINAAIRYDRYDDVGNTTNSKFGLAWSPIASLKLRGSYGTSFRAPLISQIYGNSNNLFGQSYQNPAGGAPLLGFAYSGPNLNLQPEEATTWSLGADWTPLPDLRLSLTYFDVLYENQVESYLSNLALLTREAEFAGTGIILRGTAARDRVLELLAQGVTLARGSFPGGDPNNVTLYVDGRNNNLGKSITRGLDVQGQYRWVAGSHGSFVFDLNGTLLTQYRLAITGSAPLVDRLNTIFNPLRLKLRAAVTWDYQPFSIRLAATRVGQYDNTAVTPTQRVDAYTPVDLSANWAVGDPDTAAAALRGLVLGVEVRNLFNEDPPYVNLAPGVNGSGGYDATTSNPIGRLFALSLRKRW
ncbi:MAG: TonB-dependent receptor [Gammaproteobacteria bacterium]|nr:TonB-dependent receptor [Gammaproteobacteria bacterium]